MGPRDPDAIRLLNWKKPVEGHSAGDFAATLLEVVRKRSSVIEGSLSVDDINDLLSELAKNTGKQYAWFPNGIVSLLMISAKGYTVEDYAATLQSYHSRRATMGYSYHLERYPAISLFRMAY